MKKMMKAIYQIFGIASVYQHLHYRGLRRKREREKGNENVFEEITAKNFPNLKKETDNQVQETQRVTNKMNPNRPIPRHSIIKMVKFREF